MRMNRTVLLTLAGGAIACAAFGTGVAVQAQQAPLSLQPPQQPPTPPKKPPARPQKPQPPKPQQEAQEQQNGAGAQANSAGAQAQPPSVFDEHVRQGKIVACANVFGTLGRLVAADSTFTAQTQWDSKVGDAHSIQSIVALNGGSANPAQRAAGVVFAAPVGKSCEGTLVRVTPTTDNCQTVGAALAKQNGQSGALGDLGLIALPNGAQVMLVPFGDGCVAVSTLRAQVDKAAQP